MAAEEGLLLNISEDWTPPGSGQAERKKFPGCSRARQRRGTPKQTKGTKRKFQGASEGPPPKQKNEISLPPANVKEIERNVRGKTEGLISSKKNPAVNTNDGQVERPFIKTSSLFKNNPEIPEIHRAMVKQIREKVFTSDSFHELGLHPHLRSDGPYALVLVPTRELALQSFDTIQKLLKPFNWIVPGVLMGGEKRKSEKARLRKGINILISTPGRLVDHIKSTKNIHFSRIQWLIIDEADRILDLGFEKDITVILNAINSQCENRQNVLLSATLTEGVTRLADISLHNPISISVSDETCEQAIKVFKAAREAGHLHTSAEPDGFAVPEKLQQHVTLVPSKLKLVTLAAFLLGRCEFEKKQKLIVFFSSCELVEFYYHLFLQTLLGNSKAPASGQSPSASSRLKFLRLHGNMEQEERTTVFQEFSQSKSGILLCTDVAARGLDLPQVTWIVQYNAPSSPAEYIHRIGRTARIGCHGSSLLILAPSEAEYVNSLASHKINVSEIKMEDILSVLAMDDRFKARQWGHKKSRSVGPQEIRERATVLQTAFEDYVHASAERVSWAKKALQSFIRAYATYPKDLKHIFHVRSLHLGHVAKSFGLRDAPHNLNASSGNKRKSKLKRPDLHKKTQSKHCLAEILRSEYSSGMEAGDAKVKKKNKHGKPSNHTLQS
ncbi:ATP-dependent DNA helicase DDX31 isoform X2 [Macrotis lagotis]|uniref:ATP-dependent DNA helicase DDX31 isoform X2 n=1 Tax=Macrotis lagotis TaxID=92651 RepID=UPI003D69E249